jgi:hypothetical protein
MTNAIVGEEAGERAKVADLESLLGDTTTTSQDTTRWITV